MRVTIIAAADESGGIGREGHLPWRCPEDLRRFRDRTMGASIVMGRLTVASLPGRLPGRTILMIGAGGFPSVRHALDHAATLGARECFIGGGQRIYTEGMRYASRAEITRIAGAFECDRFMPDLADAGWSIERVETLSWMASVEFWKR